MVLRVRNQIKKFNGEEFHLSAVRDKKKWADMEAKGFRDGGQKARVCKVSNGYAVYHKFT